jgi:hypothetical protein
MMKMVIKSAYPTALIHILQSLFQDLGVRRVPCISGIFSRCCCVKDVVRDNFDRDVKPSRV